MTLQLNVTRPSASITLSVQDKQGKVPGFHNEEFKLPAPSECSDITENANMFPLDENGSEIIANNSRAFMSCKSFAFNHIHYIIFYFINDLENEAQVTSVFYMTGHKYQGE